MSEAGLQKYFDLSREDIRSYLVSILARTFKNDGQRQEPFNPVETLLCYGLLEVVNPHRY